MRGAKELHRAARAGFSLIELVLATGLLAILMVAVISLIDGSLTMWERSETRRNLTEQATAVVELLAQDVQSLESGIRGDLLVEWETFDTDGDELRETAWPRLRLVRQASRAELIRMFPPAPQAAAPSSGAEEAGEGATPPARDEIIGPGLIEVCWVVVPVDRSNPDRRAEGLVYRGARPLLGDSSASFFDANFMKTNGMPNVAELDEVSAGLLWFQPLMATQTSIVHDGWDPGVEPAQAATCWDAWGLDRPDTTVHAWNQVPLVQPSSEDRGALPRRFRIELEFEREADLKRRARTMTRIEVEDVAFDVTDGTRLPKPGGHMKVDGEWMEVTLITRDRVTVKRGRRGTQIVPHEAGALVHWGMALVREVPVSLYREDWDL